jgi:hypothetical protein
MSDSSIGQIPRLTGRAGEISVAISPMPFRETPKGRRYPYADFGADFMDAFYPSLPAARLHGLFRVKLVCPTCDVRLDDATVGRVAFAVEVALKRIPSPIRVDVEMPGVICPRCGRSLIDLDDRTLRGHLGDALIDAFEAGGIKPG